MSERTVNGVEQKLGGFHQCYRLDGRLIALGVVDLLPHCVSGVYFIYHKDFEKWSFGKISALREACLALEGGYEYYYMGYYIHSCPKMKYKHDYQPQYFLDLETLEWDLLDDEAGRLLDKHHYLSMSNITKELESQDDTMGGTNENDVGGDDPPLEDKGDTPTALGESQQKQNNEVASAEEMQRSLANGVSLFNLNFPGMMGPSDLQDKINLDSIKIKIPGGRIVMGDVSTLRRVI